MSQGHFRLAVRKGLNRSVFWVLISTRLGGLFFSNFTVSVFCREGKIGKKIEGSHKSYVRYRFFHFSNSSVSRNICGNPVRYLTSLTFPTKDILDKIFKKILPAVFLLRRKTHFCSDIGMRMANQTLTNQNTHANPIAIFFLLLRMETYSDRRP